MRHPNWDDAEGEMAQRNPTGRFSGRDFHGGQVSDESPQLKKGDLVWIWPRDVAEPGLGLLVECFNLGAGMGDVWDVQTADGIERTSANRVWREKKDCEPDLLSGFAKMAFPLVHRTFPSMVASSIVNAQPMSVPAGSIFYMDTDTTEEEKSDDSW
jgi:hypothetical protein